MNLLNELKIKTIKQFLIMKIIIDEINNLTINKISTYTVFECIEDLFLRERIFIEERQNLKELYNELKEIFGKICDKNSEEELLKKYEINKNDCIKNENI